MNKVQKGDGVPWPCDNNSHLHCLCQLSVEGWEEGGPQKDWGGKGGALAQSDLWKELKFLMLVHLHHWALNTVHGWVSCMQLPIPSPLPLSSTIISWFLLCLLSLCPGLGLMVIQTSHKSGTVVQKINMNSPVLFLNFLFMLRDHSYPCDGGDWTRAGS